MGWDSDIPQWRSETIFPQSASLCVQAETVLLCRPWLEVGKRVGASAGRENYTEKKTDLPI